MDWTGMKSLLGGLWFPDCPRLKQKQFQDFCFQIQPSVQAKLQS